MAEVMKVVLELVRHPPVPPDVTLAMDTQQANLYSRPQLKDCASRKSPESAAQTWHGAFPGVSLLHLPRGNHPDLCDHQPPNITPSAMQAQITAVHQ